MDCRGTGRGLWGLMLFTLSGFPNHGCFGWKVCKLLSSKENKIAQFAGKKKKKTKKKKQCHVNNRGSLPKSFGQLLYLSIYLSVCLSVCL